MNKKELIDLLESRLAVLNKSERDDIISEYVQHIDNKLAEGLSEKEAVETLGNIEDIIREILDAYNVDPDYNKKKDNEINEVVQSVFHRFFYGIKGIGDYIVGQKASTLVMLFIKAAILVLVLMVCFEIGKEFVLFFAGLFGNFPFIRAIVQFMYTVVALPTMIYIFIKFIDHYTGSNICGKLNIEKATEMNTDEGVETNTVNNTSAVKVNKNGFDFSLGQILKKIIVFALKVIVVMCSIPCIFTLIFTIIAFGGSLVMAIAGYPCVGIAIGLLGFNLFGVSIMALILGLVFTKREVQ